MLLTMVLVALAGLGCARLLALTRSSTVRNVAVLALIGGAVLESLNRPLELRVMERGAPAVYEWLAAPPAAPLGGRGGGPGRPGGIRMPRGAPRRTRRGISRRAARGTERAAGRHVHVLLH